MLLASIAKRGKKMSPLKDSKGLVAFVKRLAVNHYLKKEKEFRI